MRAVVSVTPMISTPAASMASPTEICGPLCAVPSSSSPMIPKTRLTSTAEDVRSLASRPIDSITATAAMLPAASVQPKPVSPSPTVCVPSTTIAATEPACASVIVPIIAAISRIGPGPKEIRTPSFTSVRKCRPAPGAGRGGRSAAAAWPGPGRRPRTSRRR